MRFRRGIDAHDEWQVTGASTGSEALDAPGVPHQNDSHPWDVLLLAQQPTVTREGFNLYLVSVDYVRLGGSGSNPDPNDPLNAPLVYRWEMGNTTESVDQDAEGNAILNSAGERFDPPPTKNIGTLFLTVRRNEPSYDPAIALTFQNKRNSDPFFGAQPGQALCLSIAPNAEYAEDAEYIPVDYHFEFRADKFRHRIMDQGLNGWFNDNGTLKLAPFYMNITDRAGAAVLLDGTGKPIESSIKVAGNETPVAHQSPSPATIEDTGEAIFLIFEKYGERAFAPLGLQ